MSLSVVWVGTPAASIGYITGVVCIRNHDSDNPVNLGDLTAKDSSVNYKTWSLLITFLLDEWITLEHIFAGRFF